MPRNSVLKLTFALSLSALSGCFGSLTPASSGGETTGQIGENASVIGLNDTSIVVGRVEEDNGDTLQVAWPTGKATVKRAELSPLVPFNQLKAGDRVLATATFNDLIARVATVTQVSGKEVHVRYDVGDEEGIIVDGSIARLIEPLCIPDQGCLHGMFPAEGTPERILAEKSGEGPSGVTVGSRVAVHYEYKGVEYWSFGKVKTINEDSYEVIVSGMDDMWVKLDKVRLPLRREEISVGDEVLFGKPPGGLAKGYIIRAEGDEVEADFSEDASSGQQVTVGEHVFHKE